MDAELVEITRLQLMANQLNRGIPSCKSNKAIRDLIYIVTSDVCPKFVSTLQFYGLESDNLHRCFKALNK